MDRKKYRIILLDVDGTLLDFNKAESLGIRQVMKEYGVEPTEERAALYHRINKDLWESFERGEIPKEQIMETRFSLFFKKIWEESPNCPAFGKERGGFLSFGLSEREFGIQAEKLYRNNLDESAYLIPGAMEICRYISEKYPVYVVTNGVSETQYRRIRKSGLEPYFSGIFVSEDAGSQKPQKEFFDYCFARMPSCLPEETVIIGDSLTSDIKGGQTAGIDTCWYNPEGTEGPAVLWEEKRYGISRIDYVINDLMQLKKIL